MQVIPKCLSTEGCKVSASAEGQRNCQEIWKPPWNNSCWSMGTHYNQRQVLLAFFYFLCAPKSPNVSSHLGVVPLFGCCLVALLMLPSSKLWTLYCREKKVLKDTTLMRGWLWLKNFNSVVYFKSTMWVYRRPPQRCENAMGDGWSLEFRMFGSLPQRLQPETTQCLQGSC